MPCTIKSLPVVLLVGASALAGPIIRDQDGNNGDQVECIKECCLTNGLKLCSLDWTQIFDPKSDYCPADMENHEEFMRYARTCWKAMHPDDQSHNDGEDCLGHMDLCPLLLHLSPGGDDQPWSPLDGVPHGDGPRPPQQPPIAIRPHDGSGPSPAVGDPSLPGLPLLMPQSEQGDCPDLGLCPLIHKVVPGDGPQGHEQPHGDPQGSLSPVGAGSGSLPPSSAYPWWWNGNGQTSRPPLHGDSLSGALNGPGSPRPGNDNGNGLNGDVNFDPSSRPVGDSNDRPTLSSSDHNGPFAVVDEHGQNDQDHRLNIIGDDDPSRNSNGDNLDVQAGDRSRQSGVPLGQASGPSSGSIPSVRPSVRPSTNNNNQDTEHGIDVDAHDGRSGEQNDLHINDSESQSPRNTDGANGECQQQQK